MVFRMLRSIDTIFISQNLLFPHFSQPPPCLAMMVHSCNFSGIGAEAGGFPVQSQPGLYNKTLSPKQNPIFSPLFTAWETKQPFIILNIAHV